MASRTTEKEKGACILAIYQSPVFYPVPRNKMIPLLMCFKIKVSLCLACPHILCLSCIWLSGLPRAACPST